MNLMKLLITGIFLFSCSDEKSIIESSDQTNNVSAKLFTVNIDFQEGFESNSIYVKIDSLKYYNALLSDLVPLAGPLSSFKTFLEEGNHKIFIISGVVDGINNSKIDSLEIIIGNYEEYYIGLSKYDDTLNFKVQDYPFMYL
ncbi:MAG: hypothetical protein KDC88_13255 [Ignavibacteriae bacterium]|nr:hypothetical protein [Ignavibacteriota bacterium]